MEEGVTPHDGAGHPCRYEDIRSGYARHQRVIREHEEITRVMCRARTGPFRDRARTGRSPRRARFPRADRTTGGRRFVIVHQQGVRHQRGRKGARRRIRSYGRGQRAPVLGSHRRSSPSARRRRSARERRAAALAGERIRGRSSATSVNARSILAHPPQAAEPIGVGAVLIETLTPSPPARSGGTQEDVTLLDDVESQRLVRAGLSRDLRDGLAAVDNVSSRWSGAATYSSTTRVRSVAY